MKVSTKIIIVAAALTLFGGCAMAKNTQATQQPTSKQETKANTSGSSTVAQAPSITLTSKNQSGASVVTMTVTNSQKVSKVRLNGLNNLNVIGQNITENAQNGVGQVVATYYLAPSVGTYVLNASGVVNGQGVTSNTLNLTITQQDVTNFKNYVTAEQKQCQQQSQKMQKKINKEMKQQQKLMNEMNQNMMQMQQQMMESN